MSNDIVTANEGGALVGTDSVPLDQHPAAVYLASLSESGRDTMRGCLDRLAGMLTGTGDALACNWAALRFQHMAAIRARLQESYAPATVNKYLSALRGVLKAAWRLDLISERDYKKAVDVEGVESKTLPAGRELSAGEVGALLTECQSDERPAGRRDAAIIAVLYSWGLRRSELTGLDLADYDSQTGRLVVRGKGRKERECWLVGGARAALDDWLAIRGDVAGPLFWPITQAGEMSNARLTPQAVYALLKRRADRAGVEDFSPHDLRRTFVSHLLAAGADLSVVSKMAGHASIETTQRYDRRGEDAKREAATLLHVPYAQP